MSNLTKTALKSFTLLSLTGCSLFGIRSVEEPRFQVLLKEEDKEIRSYPPLIIAKTFIEGDYETNSSKAFRKIANYIFGENIAEQKVSMTSPVIQQPAKEEIAMTSPVVQRQDSKGWYMYFIMPSKYNLENLPKPKNPEVLIESLPKQTHAVLSYSGFTTSDKIQKYGRELVQWAKSKNYEVLSTVPRSARYNPPWTLPFLRHNEVHLEVKAKSDSPSPP